MKTKKLRIVSLLIAAIMMMSLSGMALAYEDDIVDVVDMEMPVIDEHVFDEHGDIEDFVGVEPTSGPSPLCAILGSCSYGGPLYFVSRQAAADNSYCGGIFWRVTVSQNCQRSGCTGWILLTYPEGTRHQWDLFGRCLTMGCGAKL